MTCDAKHASMFVVLTQTYAMTRDAKHVITQACDYAMLSCVQALLANIAAMYGVYHGPKGLTDIATRCNGFAHIVAAAADKLGHSTDRSAPFFDTIKVNVGDSAKVCATAVSHGINLRPLDSAHVTISIDETTTFADVDALIAVLNGGSKAAFSAESLAPEVEGGVGAFARTSKFMEHPIFNSYHCEHDMLRYLKLLENRCVHRFAVDDDVQSLTQRVQFVSESCVHRCPFADVVSLTQRLQCVSELCVHRCPVDAVVQSLTQRLQFVSESCVQTPVSGGSVCLKRACGHLSVRAVCQRLKRTCRHLSAGAVCKVYTRASCPCCSLCR